MLHPHAVRGFTLFELTIVLAVFAVLAGLTLPAFERFSRELQLSRSANALLVALHQARSAAISRGVPVELCAREATHCATRAPAAGWLVIARQPDGAALLGETDLPSGMWLTGSRSSVTFWPATRAGTTATFTLCDARHLAPPRAVIVSQTGRPRAARVAADDSPLQCPDV